MLKESRRAGGRTVCRCNAFTACGHQKIEMLWGHAGNYHGAAFVLVAWNSHRKGWIQESIVATPCPPCRTIVIKHYVYDFYASGIVSLPHTLFFGGTGLFVTQLLLLYSLYLTCGGGKFHIDRIQWGSFTHKMSAGIRYSTRNDQKI